MSTLAQKPPELWRDEIIEFIRKQSFPLIERYQHWVVLSTQYSDALCETIITWKSETEFITVGPKHFKVIFLLYNNNIKPYLHQ